MKQRLWLLIVQALLAVIGAFATYSRGVTPGEKPVWVVERALTVKPYALTVGLAAALLLILMQFLAAIIGNHTVKKATIQKCINTLVGQLQGRAKHNRITVFKRVGRTKAVMIALWRLKWAVWKLPRRKRLKRLWKTTVGGDYLIPYVRSTGSRNPNSASVFRVSDRENECEGVAGLAWEEDFIVRANLPVVTMEEAHKVPDWTSLRSRKPQDPIRKYAERTGIRSIEQLHAFRQFAKHFMGTVIVVPDKKDKPWGVLLLDSEQADCPFEADAQGGAFAQQFKTAAEILGNLVR